MSQLIFGLVVCFLTFGTHMFYAPYVLDEDDNLAQLCQAEIFFSLLSSIALKYDAGTLSNASNMDILLTTLTMVPISLAFLFETPLFDPKQRTALVSLAPVRAKTLFKLRWVALALQRSRSSLSSAEPSTSTCDCATTSTSTEQTPKPPPEDVKMVPEPTVHGGVQAATFEAGPLGIGLMQYGEAVAVGCVDSGSAAEAQGVRLGSILVEVSGATTKGKGKQEVIAMVARASRPITVKFCGSSADAQATHSAGIVDESSSPSPALVRARSRRGSAHGASEEMPRRPLADFHEVHLPAQVEQQATTSGVPSRPLQPASLRKFSFPLSDFHKAHLPPEIEPQHTNAGVPSNSSQPTIDRKPTFKKQRMWSQAQSSSGLAANALTCAASFPHQSSGGRADAPLGSGGSQADEQIANEVEAELKDLRTKLDTRTLMPPIVRRGQTVKQFMDDSKKAAEAGLGV